MKNQQLLQQSSKPKTNTQGNQILS